jgi:glycosyltransferase involved in cell wall biosynthesis
MPTANRRPFIRQAVRYFLAQDYLEKELLILDDGEQSVEDLVPPHPQIRYHRRSGRQSVGAKRNRACNDATGEIIVHWDDDDWSASWRLSYQLGELLRTGADVCGLDRVFFIDPKTQCAWEYVYPRGGQPWVYGATLCYRKALWRRNPFPDIDVGEDSHFVWNARGARVHALQENAFFVGTVHDGNTSPKQVRDPRWQPRSVKMLQMLMGKRGFSCTSSEGLRSHIARSRTGQERL